MMKIHKTKASHPALRDFLVETHFWEVGEASPADFVLGGGECGFYLYATHASEDIGRFQTEVLRGLVSERFTNVTIHPWCPGMARLRQS